MRGRALPFRNDAKRMVVIGVKRGDVVVGEKGRGVEFGLVDRRKAPTPAFLPALGEGLERKRRKAAIRFVVKEG